MVLYATAKLLMLWKTCLMFPNEFARHMKQQILVALIFMFLRQLSRNAKRGIYLSEKPLESHQKALNGKKLTEKFSKCVLNCAAGIFVTREPNGNIRSEWAMKSRWFLVSYFDCLKLR